MRDNILFEKEPEEMTNEELENELKETFKNIRKVSILENLPLSEWTKDELIEVIMEFGIRKFAGSLEEYINTIPEFVISGLYKKYVNDFEEYKVTKITAKIKSELSMKEKKKLRPHSTLENLTFEEWTKQELLEFVTQYNKYYENWWD